MDGISANANEIIVIPIVSSRLRRNDRAPLPNLMDLLIAWARARYWEASRLVELAQQSRQDRAAQGV
jgi:hypothetical protein